MVEVWKPVVGYELHYEVSNLGRVRRVMVARGATVGRILRDRNQNGYRAVQLCKDDVKRKIGLHIIVCEAFHGRRPLGKVPNHIDLNKHNNHSDNLEWLTHLENVRHAVALGACGGRPMPGAENPRAKLTVEQVAEIRALKGVLGARRIAERFGVSRSAIQFIHQGKHWKTGESAVPPELK